jgi:hypothetical protein
MIESHATRSLTRHALTNRWWQLMLAGPGLLIAVVVGSAMGIEAWFLGIIIVIAAFAMTGVGALLGVLRLYDRRTGTART